MTLDPQACRDLATEVVLCAVADLKAHHKAKDVEWFEDARKSEFWIVGAGLDYDATISRLRAQGHLTATATPTATTTEISASRHACHFPLAKASMEALRT